MPNTIRYIKETMQKQKIPEDVMAQFDFAERFDADKLVALYRQMDALLTPEQVLRIMECQGCCTTGKVAAAHTAFGRKYANLPLNEKIERLGELNTVHNPPCRLNDDGTLTAFWDVGEPGAYECVCGMMRNLTDVRHLPRTFCACGGGHARKSLQRSLGVKLKLREVVSSALSSNGEKGCEFLFDVE